MKVYHGTSKQNLRAILNEGVAAPSYWAGDFASAAAYAQSHGESQAVVLVCDTNDYEFRANLLVAESLMEEGEFEGEPLESDDLARSLAEFEGIVCHNTITSFEVLPGHSREARQEAGGTSP
jgi:hypothetical protein